MLCACRSKSSVKVQRASECALRLATPTLAAIKGEGLPILDEHPNLSGFQVICESKGQPMKTTTTTRVSKKGTGPRNMTQHVCMEYLNTGAKSVYVAGTFNNWHPQVTEMLKLEDGRWAKELTLTPGTYE